MFYDQHACSNFIFFKEDRDAEHCINGVVKGPPQKKTLLCFFQIRDKRVNRSPLILFASVRCPSGPLSVGRSFLRTYPTIVRHVLPSYGVSYQNIYIYIRVKLCLIMRFFMIMKHVFDICVVIMTARNVWTQGVSYFDHQSRPLIIGHTFWSW